MSTGASLGVDLGTLEEIMLLPELPEPLEKVAELSFEGRADLTAAIIRVCLDPENMVRVQYQNLEENRRMAPVPKVETTLKVGRNEPCPCGSGKKYKKCCGAVVSQ